MSALKCEICKVGNLVKKDGFFECENCGAKYTVEEAVKVYAQSEPNAAQRASADSPQRAPAFEKMPVFSPISEAENTLSGKSKKKYAVDVPSQYSVPKYCACCMSPKASVRDVICKTETRSGSHKSTYSIKGKTYYCDSCVAHQEEVKTVKTRCFILSFLLGMILAIISVAIFKFDASTSSVIGMILPVLSLVVVSLVVKLPALPSNHAARIRNVVLKSEDMPSGYESTISMFGGRNSHKPITKLTFIFENKEYAQLFRNANLPHSSNIQELPSKNTARKISLLAFDKDLIFLSIGLSFLFGMVMLPISQMLTK